MPSFQSKRSRNIFFPPTTRVVASKRHFFGCMDSLRPNGLCSQMHCYIMPPFTTSRE